MEPWHWVRRALTTALTLIAIGWAVGLTGALIAPRFGWIVGAVGLFLAGGGWAVSRIGGAGVAAGLMGLIAAGGMAVESHHFAVATTATVVDLPSLAAWNPDSSVVAAHVPELVALHEQRSRVRVRTGSGKTASTNVQVVTPLLDSSSGDVVGFHCRSDQGSRRGDGAWVLSTAAWSGGGPVNCAAGVASAMQKCDDAGIPVVAGSQARFVEVFATKSGLRTAYDLRAAVGVPLGLFAVYSAAVVAFRRKGASP